MTGAMLFVDGGILLTAHAWRSPMSWRFGIGGGRGHPPPPTQPLPARRASPNALIDPPCYCYLATDGERNIIVDSGPDRARSGAAGLEIMGDTSDLLTAGLKAWGVGSADVDCIVHTHLHHDHMQNDLMFPNAVVHVQQAELAWATGPDCGRFYVGVSEIAAGLGDRLHTARG